MQLTLLTFAFVILLCVQEVKAQVKGLVLGNKDQSLKRDTTKIETSTYTRSDWKKVEVNFLNSYYSQDGNNGAVTGGIGTEQLTDFTQKVSVSIPTNPKLKLNISGAYDYYSSASTDNIDNVRSSDSSSDVRAQFTIGAQYQASKELNYGLNFGTSLEYDYTSIHGGFNFGKASKDGNSRLDLFGQAFIDKWYVIYPREIRREVSVPTDKRQSYNLALNYSQVINKRMQFSLIAEATYMNGLLSTPFHRVYFKNAAKATIEVLPSTRLKIPLALRYNFHISEKFILRAYYRYYWDNWGMQGHTLSAEIPYKVNRFFAVYPYYRFHTQSSVDHFAGYQEHVQDANFYTSDYDLSALTSNTLGLGILYSPSDGLANIKIPFVKNRILMIESIDLKGAVYNRSTGLNAFIVSLGVKVGF